MNFISIVVFLLLISSGSVFASSYFNKKYEEVLPITCFGIILISFLFGIIGLLRFSTIVICLIGLILYIFAIKKAVKEKNSSILKLIFTPAFYVFLILMCFVIIGVYNKVITGVDEYSHWGDIVKVMTLLDTFGTNHNAHSLFASYPPAMSLFQYTLEEINFFISGENFSEWLTYLTYDILAIAFVLPVCSKFNENKVFSFITYVILIATFPFAFYLSSYFSLYIDSFLSFLIASGLIELLWSKEKDVWFDLRMYSIIFILTLAKDTGLLFAALLLAGYIAERIVYNKDNILNKNNVFSIIIGVLSLAIPKLLWSLNVSINGANKAFSEKIDLINLIKVLTGKDDSYRPKVLKNYISELVTNGKQIGNTGCYINYALLLFITIGVVYIFIEYAKTKKIVSNSDSIITNIISFLIITVFIVGMCIIYMYKFSEDEALGLASLDRYLSIVYFGEWLFIVLSILILISNTSNFYKSFCVVLICFSLICTSLETIVTFVSNAFAKASLAVRDIYYPFTEEASQYFDGDDKIWFINQYSDNEDSLAFNYLIRPNHVEGPWSIGIPDDEYDVVTEELTPEEWKNELISRDYDYVVLYDVNGVFREYYSSCFDDPNNIDDKQVYRVDKTNGMLILCE